MRLSRSRWLNIAGIAVFAAAGTLLLLIWIGGGSAGRNARASEAFGKALEKEGIPTQAGPSK